MGNWDTTPTLISKKHSPDEASLTLILFLIANLNTRLILEAGSWSAPIVILSCRGRWARRLQAAALRASLSARAEGNAGLTIGLRAGGSFAVGRYM